MQGNLSLHPRPVIPVVGEVVNREADSTMKFKVRFLGAQIDLKKYNKVLDVQLGKLIEQAGYAWLNAFVLRVIPVWSGASRSTFLKLAREVNFPLTVTGISAPRDLISSDPSRYGPRAGFQRSKGEVSKGEKPGVYTFRWETNLFQLVFNELQDANANPVAGRLFSRLKRPGPYNFQELGQAAFHEFSRDKVKLPNPWQSITLTSIRRGR